MESLKRMAGTLLAIFQTRLDLLSIEIEEERLNIGQMVLYGSIALLFFGLAILLLTIFIVVLLWDSYRLPVLGSFIGLYFVCGAPGMECFAPYDREKIQTVFRQYCRIGR